MQQLLYKTKSGGSPKDKPRVYFTCHPDDFDRTFCKVCEDIFKTHDCVIYYTENMTELLPEETRALDLERMNLFVVPVTCRLMTTANRANDFDLPFAKERNIAILPLMFETGINELYAKPENFGNRQYLSPFSRDTTEISYEGKLKKFLESTLFDSETEERVRKTFDAYIFLSYRKMDRVYANDLMKLIHADPRYRDIAIWYDEFLTPGEAFDQEIVKALDLSSLFAMAVTPNLLKYTPDGKPNYVIQTEYPMAKKIAADSGRGRHFGILPVQMTDLTEQETAALGKEFSALPDCVNGHNAAELSIALFEQFKEIALTADDSDPEHTFLIGIAYLNGIDVETDPERGLSLITKAAEAGLPEAMTKLARMYGSGDRVQLDLRKQLEWWEKLYGYYLNAYGEEHPYTLLTLHNLAISYGMIGDYDREAELLEESYTRKCRTFGEEHLDTLSSLYNLADAYGSKGDYGREAELSEKAYAICRRAFGEEHPDTLYALGSLAMAYYNHGEFKRALELQEALCALRCKVSGEEHRDTLFALSGLAVISAGTGSWGRALETEEKIYTLRCKTLGEEHPDTLASLHNMAGFCRLLGDYGRALELGEKVCSIRSRVLGEEHPDTFRSANELAMTCGNLGDYRRKADMEEKIYASRRKLLGEEHPETLATMNNLAMSFGKLGDTAREIEWMEKAYTLYCKVLGEEHPQTLTSLNNLAMAYGDSGDCRRENELEEKVYALCSKVLGEEHPYTLNALNTLASTYGKLGDTAKEIESEEKAYTLLCKVLGEEHPNTLMTLNNLAVSYLDAGDTERAVMLEEKVYTLRCRKLGAEHPDTQAALRNLNRMKSRLPSDESPDTGKKDPKPDRASVLSKAGQKVKDLFSGKRSR